MEVSVIQTARKLTLSWMPYKDLKILNKKTYIEMLGWKFIVSCKNHKGIFFLYIYFFEKNI